MSEGRLTQLYVPGEQRVLADWLIQVFGADVAAAQHADPMRDEDWLYLAASALRKIKEVRDAG